MMNGLADFQIIMRESSFGEEINSIRKAKFACKFRAASNINCRKSRPKKAVPEYR